MTSQVFTNFTDKIQAWEFLIFQLKISLSSLGECLLFLQKPAVEHCRFTSLVLLSTKKPKYSIKNLSLEKIKICFTNLSISDYTG